MIHAHVKTKQYSGGDRQVASRLNAIVSAATELFASDSYWLWVTVESDGSNDVIQIARDFDCALINIPHKQRHGLLPIFEWAGLLLPSGWNVTKDKRKGLFSAGFLELRGNIIHPNEVGLFVEEVGAQILGWNDALAVTCSLQA